jgi:hypothetical protein
VLPTHQQVSAVSTPTTPQSHGRFWTGALPGYDPATTVLLYPSPTSRSLPSLGRQALSAVRCGTQFVLCCWCAFLPGCVRSWCVSGVFVCASAVVARVRVCVRFVAGDQRITTTASHLLPGLSEPLACECMPHRTAIIVDCTWSQAVSILSDPRLAALPHVHIASEQTLFWR